MSTETSIYLWLVGSIMSFVLMFSINYFTKVQKKQTPIQMALVCLFTGWTLTLIAIGLSIYFYFNDNKS